LKKTNAECLSAIFNGFCDYWSGSHRPLDRLLWVDSVEKVGFSDRLNSGTTTTGEPTHHIEWFFGPSVTFAALLLG
jgi:hypothetical protein